MGPASRSNEVFAQSGHPTCRGISALTRRTLQRKEGRNTVHFTADSENIELILSTIHSANQLGIYGAVSTLCVDLSESMHGRVSIGVNMSISEENEQLSQQVDPQEVGSLARSSRRTRSRGKLLARTLKKVRNDDSRRTTSHCKRKSRIRQNSLERNVLQNPVRMWTMDL